MVAGDAVNTASRVQSAAAPGPGLGRRDHPAADVLGDHLPRRGSATSSRARSTRCRSGRSGPWSPASAGPSAPTVSRPRSSGGTGSCGWSRSSSTASRRAGSRRCWCSSTASRASASPVSAWEFEKYVDGLTTSCAGTAAGAWPTGRAWPSSRWPRRFVPGCRPSCRDADVRHRGRRRRTRTGSSSCGLRDATCRTSRNGSGCGPGWCPARHRLGRHLPAGGPLLRLDRRSSSASPARTSPVVLLIDDAQHADDGLLLFIEHLLVRRRPSRASWSCSPGPACSRSTRRSPRTGGSRVMPPRRPQDRRHRRPCWTVSSSACPTRCGTALVARSEGVPLFAVETVRSLIDRDLVVPRGGQYVLADPERSTSTRSVRRPRCRP